MTLGSPILGEASGNFKHQVFPSLLYIGHSGIRSLAEPCMCSQD